MARAVASLTQRGTATVELAIALPLLLLVMLTTAEVGRLLSQYNSLTKSVRGSCRYVAANAAPGTNGLVSISPALRAQAVNLAVFGNVGGTGTALLPGLAAANVSVAATSATYVSVTAVYTYQPMLGSRLADFGFGTPSSLAVPLSVSTVMKVLE